MNSNIKGASLYVLKVPGVGVIEAHMNASEALRFVASIEQQLDDTIPRSLRTEPVSISEIEALDMFAARAALEQARNALAKTLNNSATTGTLANALNAVEGVLKRSEGQS